MSRFKIIAAAALFVACAGPLAASADTAQASWENSFDLDGDGARDAITVDYTGGAHCCYRLSVRLTSTGETHRLPFQLDGGYVGGLNLGQPDRFDIRRTDGELPELVMEIETYSGEPRPLPDEWMWEYGITTHCIAVSFGSGWLRVRDWPRRGTE